MSTWIAIVIVIIVGTVTPIQSGVNSFLAKYLDHPVQAGFISFAGGFLIMCLLCMFSKHGFPKGASLLKAPPLLLTGGILGSIFIMTAIVFAPKLGATVFLACVIAGQLAASVLLDHFGWLGFTMHPVNVMRIVGVMLLFLGVLLVKIY